MVARRTLSQRAETFGLGTPTPWALPALRLVFCAPRVFSPLADAWERRHPGSCAALERLVASGFVLHQPPVVIDTVDRAPADAPSRPVARYRITAAGSRLLEEASVDVRVLSDVFVKASASSLEGVLRGLRALASAQGVGLSARGFAAESGMGERVARAWLARLEGRSLVAMKEGLTPDTVVAVPGHWRPSSLLVRQLKELLEDPAFLLLSHLGTELGLGRRRQLADIRIDPAEYAGVTDYDHDVRAQAVLAKLVSDTYRVPRSSAVRVEPSLSLLCRPSPEGFTVARESATMRLSYRPDAEFRESGLGAPARTVLEYERMQTRRDAWTHMEKFAAMMHQEAFPFEIGILRFVVDGPRRAAAYRDLVAAYAAYIARYPEAAPTNLLRLMVADSRDLLAAADPYDPALWDGVEVRGAGAPSMLVHGTDDSPYDDFFRRSR